MAWITSVAQFIQQYARVCVIFMNQACIHKLVSDRGCV